MIPGPQVIPKLDRKFGIQFGDHLRSGIIWEPRPDHLRTRIAVERL